MLGQLEVPDEIRSQRCPVGLAGLRVAVLKVIDSRSGSDIQRPQAPRTVILSEADFRAKGHSRPDPEIEPDQVLFIFARCPNTLALDVVHEFVSDVERC